MPQEVIAAYAISLKIFTNEDLTKTAININEETGVEDDDICTSCSLKRFEPGNLEAKQEKRLRMVKSFIVSNRLVKCRKT